MLTVSLPSTLQEERTYSSSYSQPRHYMDWCSNLLSDSFTRVERTTGTQWTGGQVRPNIDMHVLNKRQNFYSLQNRITNCRLLKLLPCHYNHRSIRFQHATQTVLLLYICFMTATINFKPQHFSLFVREKPWVDYLSNLRKSSMKPQKRNQSMTQFRQFRRSAWVDLRLHAPQLRSWHGRKKKIV
jgi:hypothetical protein